MKKGTKRPRPAFNLDRISSDFQILPSAAEINKLLQKDQEHRKEITLFVETFLIRALALLVLPYSCFLLGHVTKSILS